jgi:hypothetical protein
LAAAIPRDDDGLAGIDDFVIPGRDGPNGARVYRPLEPSPLPVVV